MVLGGKPRPPLHVIGQNERAARPQREETGKVTIFLWGIFFVAKQLPNVYSYDA
jgi:hypothetical protein